MCAPSPPLPSRVVLRTYRQRSCLPTRHRAGVPQIVLPMWMDLYNFAQLAEQVGVGVWGSRRTAPEWTAEELSASILKVVDGGPASVSMREKAKSIGDRAPQGRNVAADIIADLARAS